MTKLSVGGFCTYQLLQLVKEIPSGESIINRLTTASNSRSKDLLDLHQHDAIPLVFDDELE